MSLALSGAACKLGIVRTQPGTQGDLHGSAPDTHHTCLLLIDVINDFDFPRGEELFAQAQKVGPSIAALKKQARAAGVPSVYVNDNFGHWRSSQEDILKQCLRPASRGRPFVELLRPDPEDYFVLKPKHSAFYQTPLELLLKHFGTERLILAGLSSNSCILATANDAYMRDLKLVIPDNCIAACNEREHNYALDHMKLMLKADVRPWINRDLSFLSDLPEQ
jgi:nicotinamidase-related amidase